eukprot:GEZU01042811.1.p2 GENE.GEZU01042811.1~~GEZU01042811.1.p2  ORF type:complete len:177 (-),score=32.96 GEZU01042811.1:930-1460(-)
MATTDADTLKGSQDRTHNGKENTGSIENFKQDRIQVLEEDNKKLQPTSHESEEELRKSPMMAHLMDSLNAGKNIGHYGRLVFAMIARHFLKEDEVIAYLTKDKTFTEHDAAALYKQIIAHNYNPPSRERIIQWQRNQEFPICPDIDDPQSANVYRELKFPPEVYHHITEFYEHKNV